MIWMDVDAALSGVPVNAMPLIDDADFKSIEASVAYNAAGMALQWNFVTPAGAYTQTAVTPTTSGTYDWANQGSGMYSIEMPASAGGSINNDTEGYGWFSGVATGVLPWAGPLIGFRASGLNDALVESAYSATRGLAGTALPNAAAEASGGLYTRGTGAGQLSQSANGELGLVTLAQTLATYTGNTPQTGDNFPIVNSGTFGNAAIKTLIDAIDDFVDTEVAAILASTDTEVAAILALLDDARGEPGQGAPPVNPDMATKVDYLYKLLRNKLTQTATTLSVFADDGTTVDHKSTVSDNGTTYTRGEIVSGP